MKYYLSLFILSFIFNSQSFSQNGKMIDHIAAIIGNEIIIQSDIEAQYQTQNLMMPDNVTEQEAKCIIMEELLYQKLLLNQAQLDSIEITDDQVESELERRMRYFTNQIGSEQKLEEYYGKSILEIKAEFRDLVKNQLLIQTIQSKITDNIKATPSDIKNYFESIPQDSLPFINSELEIAQIVKKPAVNEKEKLIVKEKLENLRQRIINGEDFGTLAYLYSEDPLSAKQNGELGFVPRGSLVPEFEAVAFRLSSNPDKNLNGGKGNEVSEIIETLYGFHILQLIERRGETVNVRHILLIPKVSPQDLTKAKAFLDSIAVLIEIDSLTFAEAAMKFSDDKDTKTNGGMMINQQDGTTRLDASQLDPVLSFMIDKMKPGEVIEPALMNTLDGKQAYRLLKLISRTNPHVANLKDDYNRIQKAALAEKQNTAIDKWIKKKQANTYMKIDDEYKKCNFAYNWFTP
ncbi:MAG: peptidylprolyl isomerase [Bacteroidota bacterium]